jgi:hypothetical protein
MCVFKISDVQKYFHISFGLVLQDIKGYKFVCMIAEFLNFNSFLHSKAVNL